jgi:hypothetical protein
VELECYCNALQTYLGKLLRIEAKGEKCVVLTGRCDGPHDKVNCGFPMGILTSKLRGYIGHHVHRT